MMKLLSKARTMFGPIKAEYAEAISEYLQNPTFEGWDKIHSMVIRWDGRTNTVWQAVIAVDPRYADIAVAYSNGKRPKPPSMRWVRIPDAITTARAIKLTLDKP